jgi:hypothetical protein
VLPILVSAGLVVWLVWRISPDQLIRGVEGLNWKALAVLTLALVVTVFLWDVVCIRWLYALPDQALSYGVAADARAGSYLVSAINYEAGQALLAWKLARIQNLSRVGSLSRCVLLALHDLMLLLVLSLAGTLIDPAGTRWLAHALIGALAGLTGLALTWRLLPNRLRARILSSRWGNWIGWWRWRHSLVLFLLRLVYFGIMGLYAVVGLRMCGIAHPVEVLCSAVPLVLLADALPSVSGFGTRHYAFESLLRLDSAEQAIVFHFSTFWSAGLMLGRAGIGLANLWLAPLFSSTGENGR